MAYLLLMLMVVGGLFATDGGSDLEKLTSQKKVQAQVMTTGAKVTQVTIGKIGVDQLSLYRYELMDKRQCVISHNQQALACSEGPVEVQPDQSLKAHRFDQLPFPAPGIHRVVFNDGLECLVTAAKTGIACHWAKLAEKPLVGIKTNELVSSGKVNVYLLQYEDEVTCVVPKSKVNLWCKWPNNH